MDDDRKKPAGNSGKRRGPQAGGDRKPFRKREEGKPRPFAKAEGGKKPFRKRDDAPVGEGGEKRPFRKHDGERKPFAKAEGGKKPFRRRDDAPAGEGGEKRPFRRRDGESKPFAKAEGADRPYRRRDGAPAGESGEKRPFRKHDGERKPFRKPEGEKPFRKREDAGERSFRPGRREREAGVDATASDGGERIARRLARAGVASRRDAEELIAAGRVKLNGKVLSSPAVNVTGRDRIELDDKEIPAVERTRLFLFHKPAGVVTTNRDPEGRKTVFDILPAGLPRLMTVGRLDINTEGLLLLTNDGGLSRVLELPATGWLRRYRVRVHGKVEPEALEALKEGIAVDGVFYGAIDATLDREQGSNAWLTLSFREGKNREVKNVLGALGLDVTRLIRVSYGPFQLGELAEGEVRELKGKLLRDQLGDRLIAESGANFDAPVLNEFSNKPVSAAARKPREESAERSNRKREREQKREDALGRLQTKKPPARGAGRGDGKPPSREERPVEQPRQRKANVWMAPGAKPMGEKKAAALAERNEGRRYAGKPRPGAGGKGGRPGAPAKGPRKPRGDR